MMFGFGGKQTCSGPEDDAVSRITDEEQKAREDALAKRLAEKARIEAHNRDIERQAEEARAKRDKLATQKPAEHFQVIKRKNGDFLKVRNDYIPLRYVASITIERHGWKPCAMPDYSDCERSSDLLRRSAAERWAMAQVDLPIKHALCWPQASILIETSAGRKFTIRCPDVHVEQVYESLIAAWVGKETDR